MLYELHERLRCRVVRAPVIWVVVRTAAAAAPSSPSRDAQRRSCRHSEMATGYIHYIRDFSFRRAICQILY